MLLDMGVYRTLCYFGVQLAVYLGSDCVTNRCILADDEAGFVVLLKLDNEGRVYYARPGDPDSPLATEKIYGNVRIIRAA